MSTTRELHPHIRAGVRRGRTLGECHYLTQGDWAQVFDAYLAFLYQVRLVCDRREANLGIAAEPSSPPPTEEP